MTHEDRGHYSKKHKPGREVRPDIAEAVTKNAANGTISCATAHKIARELNISPEEIGFTIDSSEIRITKCQLGLHGFRPEKKIVKAAETLSQEMETAINDSLVDGRLSCAAAWDIAKKMGMARMEVSAACEALGVKIYSCQLGAF